MKPCPTRCGGTRKDAHILCASCWQKVPKHERDAVWASLRDNGTTSELHRRVCFEVVYGACKRHRATAEGAVV